MICFDLTPLCEDAGQRSSSHVGFVDYSTKQSFALGTDDELRVSSNNVMGIGRLDKCLGPLENLSLGDVVKTHVEDGDFTHGRYRRRS